MPLWGHLEHLANSRVMQLIILEETRDWKVGQAQISFIHFHLKVTPVRGERQVFVTLK